MYGLKCEERLKRAGYMLALCRRRGAKYSTV